MGVFFRQAQGMEYATALIPQRTGLAQEIIKRRVRPEFRINEVSLRCYGEARWTR